MYNSMSSNEEFSTQPQNLNAEKPLVMKNNQHQIFQFGNGGFGDVSKFQQEPVLEDATAHAQAVVPTRNHLNQNFSFQAANQIGPAKRKILNNNPWGEGIFSGAMSHPRGTVPPPNFGQQGAWAWAQSSQYPVKFNNGISSFSSHPGNSSDQQIFDSSQWSRHRPFNVERGPTSEESTTLSPSLSPGQERKVVKKRTSGELLRLLDKKLYETDRLKKAEERAERLAREEELVEREKLLKLKTEIRKLEQKRKQQEWQTHQRQERLIRKKEKLNGSARERSRSGVRSRSMYPQMRRSRSRSSHRSRQKPVAVRNRRNSRRSSRSRSRTSFRKASFTSRNREQSRSPSRRILFRRDHERTINENLIRLADTDPATERYLRYTRTRSRSSEPRRGKSTSRQERRSPGRSRHESSGASTREREEVRGRYRSRSGERRRSRTRSRCQRF